MSEYVPPYTITSKILDLTNRISENFAKLLAEEVGISVRKIEENIAKLKKIGAIEGIGGTRGYWEVKR